MPTYKLYRGSYHFATVDANSSAEARRMARDFGEGRAKGEVIDYDRAGKPVRKKIGKLTVKKVSNPRKQEIADLTRLAKSQTATSADWNGLLKGMFAARTGGKKKNSKRSKQKRMSVALTRWLKKQNPGKMKGVTRVRVRKLKGGGVTITPVR